MVACRHRCQLKRGICPGRVRSQGSFYSRLEETRKPRSRGHVSRASVSLAGYLVCLAVDPLDLFGSIRLGCVSFREELVREN